jgi:hypothetical protein
MESKKIKNYLLGLMSENDVEAVDLQILSDKSMEETLLEAENELIEDYLDENLSNEEIKAFNENYLINDERRKRVEFVRLMRSYAEKQTTETEIKPSFFEQIKSFFTLRPFTLAFASIALILALGIVWQVIFNSNKVSTDTELIALNKQDLSNLDEFKNLKNLSLISGNTRSSGNGNLLKENDLTDRILLRLALPNQSANKDFTVKISQNNQLKQTFTQRTIGQEVRLLIPKSILAKGEYQITLEKDSEKYNYYFAVE